MSKSSNGADEESLRSPKSSANEGVLTSATQIRRAAGGKDTAYLKRLLQGWTSDELDTMASHDGKGALHMAAWYGSLDNINFLLDFGCNVNQIATGPYSYGKTPIFFATTRCRDDACLLLLQRGANVCIVNNKGQSVLSLSSSHLKSDTVKAIQEAETKQRLPWQNYRITHSDGAIYGDLDPRFLDRPLESTDVVTDLAVNPTDKTSRKGNFARNNPGLAREIKKPQQKPKKKPPPPGPSQSEWEQHQLDWKQLEDSLQKKDPNMFGKSLAAIVRFGECRKQSWIPDTAKRLQAMCSSVASMDDLISQMDIASLFDNDREQFLLQKLLDAAFSSLTASYMYEKKTRPRRTKTTSRIARANPETLRLAVDSVRDLPRDVLFKRTGTSHLSLPSRPVWIDSLKDLLPLYDVLKELARRPAPTAVVAMDTEWYTAQHNQGVHLSTLQLAWISSGPSALAAYIIDLKRQPCECNKTESDSFGCDYEYNKLVADLIDWLFNSSIMIILGFSMGHDMSKLMHFTGKDMSTKHCVDLQPILAVAMASSDRSDTCDNGKSDSRASLPSLKKCCSHCFDGWTLCKDQQCSDWSRRPLHAEQLDYAGLDAAVLLALLAELESNPVLR